jgi:hypothetical protein
MSLGFAVIPVAYKDKKPLISWEEFQHRKPTEEELASWFMRERLNIGVVCGNVSNNLVVLDFDSPKAYTDFFPGHRELEKTTMVVATKKGYHVYLRSAEPMKSFRIPELQLEVRSDGNYVVAPPSIHPQPDEEGRELQYRFVNPSVDEVSLVGNLQTTIFRRAEQLGVKRCRMRETQPHDALKEFLLTGRPYRGPHPPCLLTLLEGVPEGRRNDTCIKIASYLLTFRRMSPRKVLNVLLDWNQRNLPPMSEREVSAVVDSETKRRYRFGCESLQDVCSPKECPLLHRVSKGAVMELSGIPLSSATPTGWRTQPTAKWALTPLTEKPKTWTLEKAMLGKGIFQQKEAK